MTLPIPKYEIQYKQERILTEKDEMISSDKRGIRASDSRWSWLGRSIKYKDKHGGSHFLNRTSALKFLERNGIANARSLTSKEILNKVHEIAFPNIIHNSQKEPLPNLNTQSKRINSSQEKGVIIPSSFEKIQNVYNKFKDSKEFDKNDLEICIQQLGNIEDSYREAVVSKNESAVELKAIFEEAQSKVQEMNFQSTHLTKQDLRGINSFFTSPIETIYVDPITQKKYVQPDHSGLLKLGGQFFIEGQYIATGLIRHHTFNGKLCDILYLKKQKKQIDYEFSNHKGKIGSIQKIIIKQNELKKESIGFLEEKNKKWNYESFIIGDSIKLHEMGLSETHAKEIDAIICYYKELES